MVFNPTLISLLIAAVLGWASLIVVLLKLSPFSAALLPLGLFYASLFVSLTGTFALLNTLLRRRIYSALRQGSLLALMVCLGLAFQRLRVLTWWDGLLLLAIVALIEYYFMSNE